MAKPLKIALVILGLFVTLVVVAAVGLVMTFDPNDYRAEIESIVEEETGRDLAMRGDLELSIFPWLGVETNDVVLGNAEGFGPDPFAEIGYFGVSIRLLPLLDKQIQIGTVRLDGMRLNLARDASGQTNWDDLIAASEAEDTEPEEPPAPSTETGFEITNLAVEAIEIDDAAVTWRDDSTGQRVALSDFSLSTGRISANATNPIPVSSRFVVSLSQPATTLTIDLVAKLAADTDAGQFTLDNLRLEGTAAGDAVPAGKQQFTVATSAQLDQPAGVAKLTELTVQAAGITLKGTADATELNGEAPQLSGQLVAERFNPRSVLRALAIEPPATEDNSVLQSATLDARFSAGGTSAEIRQLTLTLDDTTLTGTAGVQDFERQALAFDLDVDRINLDRYLPPPTESPETTDTDEPQGGDINEIELPLDVLAGLNVDGRFAIAELQASGMTFNDATLRVQGKPGQPLQQSLTAKAYGGDVSIQNRVAGAADASPTYRFQGSLDELLFGNLLQDLVDKDWLQGKGLVTYDLTSQGRTVGDLRRHLSGTLQFGLSDGAIKGIDISRVLTAAESKLRGESTEAQAGGETRFNRFGGSMTLKNGVAKTTDFSAGADQFTLAAKGSVNLVSMELDYQLNPVLTAAPGGSRLDALVGKPIPVTVTGPVTSPKVRVDVKSLLRAEADERIDAEKEELRQKAEEERARLEEKVEAEKERAREKLRDRLGDFLQRGTDQSTEQTTTEPADGGG